MGSYTCNIEPLRRDLFEDIQRGANGEGETPHDGVVVLGGMLDRRFRLGPIDGLGVVREATLGSHFVRDVGKVAVRRN